MPDRIEIEPNRIEIESKSSQIKINSRSKIEILGNPRYPNRNPRKSEIVEIESQDLPAIRGTVAGALS